MNMLDWSSGQDAALSRLNQGFDSPIEYQHRNIEATNLHVPFFLLKTFGVKGVSRFELLKIADFSHLLCKPNW